MFYVYILKSLRDGKIYTGYTSNLKIRVRQHQQGKVASTKNRRPLRLIYYEAYLSEKDARGRERYLKSGGKAKNTIKYQIRRSLIEDLVRWRSG